uniref:Uncharacterized protein n=1 Tax=Arundo donax TaxID=35708 RepID=A0A0A9GYF0_ARUDO
MAQELFSSAIVRWNLLDHQFRQPNSIFYCSTGTSEPSCELCVPYH